MKVIYNSIWPLSKRFIAITIGPFVFTPLDGLSARTLAHEYRHTKQWLWFLYIGFPVMYLFGFIIGLFISLFNGNLGPYASNLFEKDARKYAELHWKEF